MLRNIWFRTLNRGCHCGTLIGQFKSVEKHLLMPRSENDEMHSNARGGNTSFGLVKESLLALKAVCWLNMRTEAETICWSHGVKTEPCSADILDMTHIDSGSYIKVNGVDFGTGATSFQASVASANEGGKIELHLDSLNGPLVETCNVSVLRGAYYR